LGSTCVLKPSQRSRFQLTHTQTVCKLQVRSVNQSRMSKRINIMLPEKTLAVLDRVAPRGNRSRFVSDAVLHYVDTRGKQRLCEQLKAGYLAHADENLNIAAEWF